MVFDLVLELKRQGKTIFFCSHILNDVERLCDRIGLLSGGSLIQQFDRTDFLPDGGEMVFLHTSRIAMQYQGKLASIGVSIRDEFDGQILAIPGDMFYSASEYLNACGIKILGCRSELVSLEYLFMSNVKEWAQ
jgi:ABC-2 type transport system ATP-binding protein